MIYIGTKLQYPNITGLMIDTIIIDVRFEDEDTLVGVMIDNGYIVKFITRFDEERNRITFKKL